MKLHRLLATATLTAVVGPMALLAAPAAHATGEAPADGAASASAAPTPAPESSATTDTGDDAQHPTGHVETTPSTAAGSTAAASAKPSTEPSPTYTRPTFCSGIPDEERGKTALLGLPSKIVAGSGWHDFTYRVTNVSEVKVMETDVSLHLGTADPQIDDVSELAVTVQWFNSAAGKWKAIEGEGADVFDNNEFATVQALEPGEYADAEMRIKIGAEAEPGSGYFFTTGHSYGEDGQCGFDEISQFDFMVLAPESEPGKVEDSEGTPVDVEDTEGAVDKGGNANEPAPQGALDPIPVSGRLAETGSSSAMPATAVLGGAAVALGAGAILVVRRRKAGSAS